MILLCVIIATIPVAVILHIYMPALPKQIHRMHETETDYGVLLDHRIPGAN